MAKSGCIGLINVLIARLSARTVETHSIMPFVVSDDPIQFVVIFKFVKIAMVIGYSSDLDFQEVAAAIEKIAMGHMYALPGATARCFHFILHVTRMVIVVFQCCVVSNVARLQLCFEKSQCLYFLEFKFRKYFIPLYNIRGMKKAA